MTTAERPHYSVIGTRPIRPDGVEKVTGRAVFGDDVRLPRLAHARILRSPHAHARILTIDTSHAERLPGVRAVVTRDDMPEVSGKSSEQAEGAYQNIGFSSLNMMARDKALFRGHAVAAVAADTKSIADKALSLIEVKYEVLKPVLSGLEALAIGAPILIDGLKTNTVFGRPAGLSDDDEEPSTNVATAFTMEIGDLAIGFDGADLVLERDYQIGAAHQGYIEPHSATAFWSPDGHLTIWCSSQGHFSIRDITAQLLAIPVGKVKVVPLEIGGGFGAKLFPTCEAVVALLSKKAGRPVKLTISRNEVFESVGPTSAAFIHLKMGATREGKIVAADSRLVFEAGAFPGSPVAGAANSMFAPYDIPNARIDALDVLVNKPKVTAYRAPGAPAGAFAVETMIDELCVQLGLDPLEFRLKNAAREGSLRVTGTSMPHIGFAETVEAAMGSDHWNSRLEGRDRGRGVASGFWTNAPGQASVSVSLLPDGSVSLIEGSPDIGGSRATVAMMLAEALGIQAEDVRPSVEDTDTVGFTSLTGGSSTTFKQGWAAKVAAEDLITKLVERVAKIWQVGPEDVSYEQAVFKSHRDAGTQLTLKEVAAELNRTGGPITASATISAPGPGPSTAVHIADVEVDRETGKVQILRYTSIIDAGTAIHPAYVEGQMQGGAAQGIGWALTEEFVYDENGRMLNSSFLDYRMPTTLDIPGIDTVIVEVPSPGHPYGVRGVGEVVIVPPLAAIANAVSRATGVRMTAIPMTPRRILSSLD